jgi:hypothetical protein
MKQTIFIVILLLTGCQSYTPPPAPVSTAKSQIQPANWIVSNGLTAAAEPITRAAKQLETFGEDMTGANILPVYVVAENRSQNPMIVRGSDMQLILPDGKIANAASLSTVASAVAGPGDIRGSGYTFGLIGVLVSNAQSKNHAARVADYSKIAFHEKQLEPNEKISGVVFFHPQTLVCDIGEAIVRVEFVSSDLAASEKLDLPISGMTYEKIPQATPSGTVESQNRGSDKTGKRNTRCKAI